MSAPDTSTVSVVTSVTPDKSIGGSQITIQKSTSVVQATAQQTGTTLRAIAAGGQTPQVRVAIPPVTLMPQAMIKQIETSSGGVRTQITTIPAAAASRAISQTSITVTRSVTPTTYIPRAAVTGTAVQAQRLATPIRTPTPPTVTGLSATAAGNFVRGTTVAAASATARNVSSPAGAVVTTSISPGTWMAGTGQVQLIRAINHQPRQRIIAQNISSSGNNAGVVTVAQAANIASGGQNQSQQQQQNQTNIQTVQTSQQPQQQTFVATLAAVMPPRQQTATLVYSNVSSTQPQQYNPTSTPAQRFTVAASLAGNQRQVRPIQLGNRTFSTAKLGVGGMNTTSISIRTPPNIPVLTPTINTAGGTTGGTLQARSTGTTGNVNLSTTSLSTTRIIQLQQQQPGTGTQQIIGSTGRIASNLMLQPIIMNAAAGGKIGIRPPTTIATKVQPSLTITQLGIGKISAAQQSAGTVTSLQGASISSSPSTANATSNVVVSATPANIVQQQQQSSSQQPTAINVNVSNNQQQSITQIVSVNQGLSGSGAGQIITAQNVPASATVVPLAITSRATNVLTGTITPIKAGSTVTSTIPVPPIAKVIPQQQLQQTQSQQQTAQNQHHQTSQSSQQIQANQSGQQVADIIASSHQQPPSHHQPTSVFIHTRPPNSGNAGTTTVIPNNGTFLSGGTFYYESVPANSVTVSTGVISLTTTTMSTASNSSAVVTSNNLSTSDGIVTSIPYNPPSGTFTIVPSGNRATIGQIQIPVSSSAAAAVAAVAAAAGGSGGGGQTAAQNVSQIQAVPIRFTTQHLTEHSLNVSQATSQQIQSQPQQQSTAGHVTIQQSQQQQIGQQPPHHQIITMTQQQPLQSQSQPHSQSTIQQTHMIIPVQTSIKIPVSAVSAASPPRTTTVTPSATSIGTAFFRKRDSDGSPIRAAKNLAPTLISMAAANNQSVAVVCNQSPQSGVGGQGILITPDRNKEIERSTSPHSRPSSNGSTTVSANSSPGVDQQMSEEISSMTPMNIRSETHFNPINDMYANHQNATVVSSVPTVPSRQQSTQQQSQIKNIINTNGSVESTPRKRSKRQINEANQQMQQHQINQQTIIVQTQSQQHQQQNLHNNQSIIQINNAAVSNISSVGPNLITNSSNSNNHDNNNSSNNSNIKPNNTAVNNKENTKPTEYIIKKPRACSLLDGYRQNWKAANNHFQRYSDVKPREERRPTVMDLANQANVAQKINGWKIYHLSAQMEDLCEIEMQMYGKLETMLQQFESHHEQSQDLNHVNELVKGNMQRSRIIVDGVNEAKTQIMKIFDHKAPVSDIIHRCASKRNFKKREKT